MTLDFLMVFFSRGVFGEIGRFHDFVSHISGEKRATGKYFHLKAMSGSFLSTKKSDISEFETQNYQRK